MTIDNVILGWMESISQKKASTIDIEEVAKAVISRCPKRKVPLIFIGSSNGALVHLSAAMNVPWIPQTFLIPISHYKKHINEIDQMRAVSNAGMFYRTCLLCLPLQQG